MELVDVHSDLLIIAALVLFLHRLRLAVRVQGVLQENLFARCAETLEQQASLNSRHHVVLLFGNQVTCLHLKVFFILSFALLDVIAEALLLDAGSDHFFLVFSELIVGDRKVSYLIGRGVKVAL